ncbi:hypothetical protein DSECCO2_376460 [anaerobic digester metagenome]
MNFREFHVNLVKTEKYPFWIRIIILTFSSWLFQGILYMDLTERYFKVLLDIILFLICFFVLKFYLTSLLALLISIMFAHTFNWIFNGQIFVLLKNLKLIKTDVNHFFIYLDNFKERIENEDSLSISFTIGSLSRDEIKEGSDLDIRVIRKKGFINGIRACCFIMLERTKALLNKFPLDIYVGDSSKFLEKVEKNELIEL